MSEHGIWILIALFAALVIFVLIKYFINYAAKVRYIKTKIDGADGWKDYVYWRKELRCYRLSVLPGLTPERVKNISHKARHAKAEKESDGLMSMLVPSVIGMACCCICLVSATFAWFTASVNTGAATIQSAGYTVTAAVSSNGTALTAADGKYSLEADKSYSVTLTASGAYKNGGYCIVKAGDAEYYTDQLASGSSITFTIRPAADGEYTFIGSWVKEPAPAAEKRIITDGCIFNGTALVTAAPADDAPSSEPQPAPVPAAETAPESSAESVSETSAESSSAADVSSEAQTSETAGSSESSADSSN